MHTEVNERSKVRNVRYRTLEFHAFLQVRDLFHIFPEFRHDELVSWITAGLEQLFPNIRYRVSSRLRFECLEVNGIDLSRVLDKFAHRHVQRVRHSLNESIRLRVHGRAVERSVAVFDSEKASSLLKC